jgi:hypothetical protein
MEMERSYESSNEEFIKNFKSRRKEEQKKQEEEKEYHDAEEFFRTSASQ